MDKVIQGLRLAKTTIALVPVSVPGLGPAVDLALNILNLVQDVKDAREECRSLATRAGELTHGIYQALNECPADLDLTTTAKHVATLLCTLEDIANMMKRRTKKRQFMKALFNKDKLRKEIEDLNTRLNDAKDLFGIRNAIGTLGALVQQSAAIQHVTENLQISNSMTTRIDHKLDDLPDRIVTLMQSVTVSMDDEGMMILRKEDLSLVREMKSSSDEDDFAPVEERIVRWQARILKTNRSVIVAKFPRPDDRFRAAITLSKQSMHPHVAPIIGHSRPDSEFAFVVLDGGVEHTPLEEFIKNVQGVKKFTWTADMARQIKAAIDYMKVVAPPDTLSAPMATIEDAESGRGGSEDNNETSAVGGEDGAEQLPVLLARDLYVTPEGTVRWNVYSYRVGQVPGLLDLSDGYIELDESFQTGSRAEEIMVSDFQKALQSPRPIERGAATLQLWEKLMRFTDYNRSDTYYWVRDLDVPWIGTVLDGDGSALKTPEGDPLPIDFAKVATDRELPRASIGLFLESHEYMWHTEPLNPLFLYHITRRQRAHAPTRVIGQRKFNVGDSDWIRNTVSKMTWDVCIRAVQSVNEHLRCRTFIMEQSVDLDLPRYLDDDELEEPEKRVSIVNHMDFILSSYLVTIGNPVDLPPQKLYFFRRVHDYKTISDFATPWGYWSTDPSPIRKFPGPNATREEVRAFTKETQNEIQFLGVSDTCKFVWMQSVAGFCFRTEVMIAVQCYHWTADERLMLRELHHCLTEAYKRYPKLTQQEIRNSVRRKRTRSDDPSLEDCDDERPNKRLRVGSSKVGNALRASCKAGEGDVDERDAEEEDEVFDEDEDEEEEDEEEEDDDEEDDDEEDEMDTDGNSESDEDDGTDEDVDMYTDHSQDYSD
ncbi:hypothetical protein PYCCODRAFT_1461607 [Trametes coccinea BRFM310]|uniref:Uncharacterized protein n=1 Tax=Trametes coccinea (strain BRFM310) TaxID=1353009 RepID=A0A1Y2I9Z3_TRAC3|nr:hypothetical protein PYCCODRAFT_1461607 [Trametes coccinea BRFM310]